MIIWSSRWRCPGSSQDRVNFYKKPGGDTAGPADQTGQTKQGIRYHMTSCLVLKGGAGWEEVNSSSGERWASGGERCSMHSTVCFVYSSYQYYCCYCSFPLLFC